MPALSKGQPDAKSGVMCVRIFNQDVVANFKAQPNSFLEPVIHAAAKIDPACCAVAEKQRISATCERHNLAGLACFQKMITRICRKNAKAFIKPAGWGISSNFAADTQSAFDEAFAATAEINPGR